MILVFSRLASNNLFFVDIKLCMANSTFLIDSLSSCLNFYLISSTCLVGSRASRILRSIKSPNLSMCFSLYLESKSQMISLFSLICLSKVFFFFFKFSCCFLLFFCSFSCSRILLVKFQSSVSVNKIDFYKSSGQMFDSL